MHTHISIFKVNFFCSGIFAKGNSLLLVIAFTAEELADAGEKRQKERGETM